MLLRAVLYWNKRYKEYLHYLVDEFEFYVKALSAAEEDKN